MNFANTHILFLIWLPPLMALVLWYGGRRRRKIMAAYADGRLAPNLAPAGLTGRRRLRAALVLCALVLLIIAMAGPRYGYSWKKIESHGVDLIIALDCSRSMLARDIQPTRLARAKREIYDLLSMLEGDRVGLVAFSGTAFLQCPLTVDYNTLHLFLGALTPDYLPVGGTNLDAAVRTAIDAFDPESMADKAVIVITDGENTSRQDPLQAAEAAKSAGVRLFCIGIGSGDGVPVPIDGGGFQKDDQGKIVMSRLDEKTLSRMALASGGAYTRSVAGDMDLESIYQDQIRGKMASAASESGRQQVWMDRFQWPLGLAAAFLMIALWIPSVRMLPAAVAVAAAGLLMSAPHAQAGHLQRGYDAYQNQAYDEALRHFIKGQLDNPNDPALLYNLGNTYYKKGDYEAAAQHYRQALRLAGPPLAPDLHYNIGNSLYRQGKLQDALESYETALNMAPNDGQISDNIDFVKKMIERQKQQQPQDNDNDQQKNDRNQDSDQGQSDSPRQQPGQSREKDSESSAPSRHEKQDTPQQTGQDQHAGEGGRQAQKTDQQPDKNGTDKPSAASRLNRLKDEPGRALIPTYQQRSVEKDW